MKRGFAVLTAAIAAAGCIAVPVAASAWTGSVKVRVIRLDGAGPDLAAASLAVRTSIGSVHLYTTPSAPGSRPEWNKSLRAWTGSDRPIVFEVLRGGATPAAIPPTPARPRERKGDEVDADDVLSTGFDGYVGEYGDDPAPRKRTPAAPAPAPAAAVQAPRVACRAELAWPPADGGHRVDCGGMVLVVETRRLR